MITIAYDKHEHSVSARTAESHETYFCPHCHVDLIPVKSENPHFRCRNGEEHRNRFCRALVNSKTKIVFRRKSIIDFINDILTPVKTGHDVPAFPAIEKTAAPLEKLTAGSVFSASIHDDAAAPVAYGNASFPTADVPFLAAGVGEDSPVTEFPPVAAEPDGAADGNPFYPNETEGTNRNETPFSLPVGPKDEAPQEKPASSLKDIALFDVVFEIAAGNNAIGPISTLKEHIFCFLWAEEFYRRVWERLGEKNRKKAIVYCQLNSYKEKPEGSAHYTFVVFWRPKPKAAYRRVSFTLFCKDPVINARMNSEISKISLPNDEAGHQRFKEHQVLICGDWKRSKNVDSFFANMDSSRQVYFWKEDADA